MFGIATNRIREPQLRSEAALMGHRRTRFRMALRKIRRNREQALPAVELNRFNRKRCIRGFARTFPQPREAVSHVTFLAQFFQHQNTIAWINPYTKIQYRAADDAIARVAVPAFKRFVHVHD